MSIERYDIGKHSPGRDFRLLYVSRSKCENDWHSRLHTHQCAEVFSILSGKGFFRVEDQQIPVHPGDVVVLDPGTLHTELSFADNPLEYIVLGAEGVEFGSPGGPRFFHISDPQDQTGCRAYLEAILQECAGELEEHLEVCSALAQVLIVRLRRRIARRDVPSSRARSNSECARVKRYMDEHFTEDINLDGLAALTHLNKHYLVHAFNKEIGCSPISYLLARRIAESKHRLETSDESVSQIGLALGFSSPSYFSQRFKKAVGLTPLEYRRSVRARPR